LIQPASSATKDGASFKDKDYLPYSDFHHISIFLSERVLSAMRAANL
jgi:hypothetical protein